MVWLNRSVRPLVYTCTRKTQVYIIRYKEYKSKSYLWVVFLSDSMLSIVFLEECFTYSIDKFSPLVTENYGRAKVSTEHLDKIM